MIKNMIAPTPIKVNITAAAIPPGEMFVGDGVGVTSNLRRNPKRNDEVVRSISSSLLGWLAYTLVITRK